MSKIKTEVKQKDAGTELAELNATAAAELAAAPVEAKAIETKPAKVDADVEALFEQSQLAADANEQAAKDRAELKAKLRTTDVGEARKGTVRESKELIAAVKADADKRGKNFSICPISGVLIVG